MTKLYHTVSITLPNDINEKVDTFRRNLVEGFNDKYNYLGKGGVWVGHLSLSTLFVEKERGLKMLDEAKLLTKNIEPFELVFGNISLSTDGKYIFLNLSKESDEFIRKLRSAFFEKIDPIRNKEIPDKFVNNWGNLSETDKKRIEETGDIYEFTPHFSLAKMDPGEASVAISSVDTSEFVDTKVLISSFDFIIQDEVKLNEFPLFAKIPLTN